MCGCLLLGVGGIAAEPTPLGARVTLALRFDGLLGGVMGKKYSDLNHRYLAMEAAGLKRFIEEGPRDPSVPLATWSAEAVRAMATRNGR